MLVLIDFYNQLNYGNLGNENILVNETLLNRKAEYESPYAAL